MIPGPGTVGPVGVAVPRWIDLDGILNADLGFQQLDSGFNTVRLQFSKIDISPDFPRESLKPHPLQF